MKEEKIEQIDFENCPEIILYLELDKCLSNNLTFTQVEKKSYQEEIVKNNLSKAITIATQTSRFNVQEPIFNGLISSNTTDWFFMWNEFIRLLDIDDKIKLKEDIEKWHEDNNYDLSKWHPKNK